MQAFKGFKKELRTIDQQVVNGIKGAIDLERARPNGGLTHEATLNVAHRKLEEENTCVSTLVSDYFRDRIVALCGSCVACSVLLVLIVLVALDVVAWEDLQVPVIVLALLSVIIVFLGCVNTFFFDNPMCAMFRCYKEVRNERKAILEIDLEDVHESLTSDEANIWDKKMRSLAVVREQASFGRKKWATRFVALHKSKQVIYVFEDHKSFEKRMIKAAMTFAFYKDAYEVKVLPAMEEQKHVLALCHKSKKVKDHFLSFDSEESANSWRDHVLLAQKGKPGNSADEFDELA